MAEAEAAEAEAPLPAEEEGGVEAGDEPCLRVLGRIRASIWESTSEPRPRVFGV